MLLAFSYLKTFLLFQIDVKSAFLNVYILKEVYVVQTLDFQNYEYSNRVYKLETLYALIQDPRAWYEKLSKVFISNGFSIRKVDTTLFIKRKGLILY